MRLSIGDFRLRKSKIDARKPSILRGLTISFIGAGTMGRALIGGLIAQGLGARAIRAADTDARARREVLRRFRVATAADARTIVPQADVVVLAVKPQQFRDVIARVAPVVHRRQLVVSIAAGIPLRWLQARLPRIPLVRAMPNLPATVGEGFAALAPGRFATARHRAVARALFEAVGEAYEMPERDFDAVTAVSGSGPAYVFFLVDAWGQAARALGLSDKAAAGAIQRTLAGSVRLLTQSSEPAATLIRRVASKGGTTEAALNVLARRRVAPAFVAALRAAARRSKALAWS